MLLLAASLALAGCSEGPNESHDAASASTPAGWDVKEDQDFALAVPSDWQVRRETNRNGNEFLTLTGPRVKGPYPESVVIGRTESVPQERFTGVVDLFKNVNGNRAFTDQRPVEVPGATQAVLVDSVREQGPTRTPVREWNLFVHTPSDVSLNFSFVAPVSGFDEGRFRTIMQTVVARQR